MCHFQNGNSRRPCYKKTKSDNKGKAARRKPISVKDNMTIEFYAVDKNESVSANFWQ